jgi:hypothetical protein
MISPDQFNALMAALKEVGMEDKVRNNPTNLFIRGIFGSGVEKIFAILPEGAWPDIFEVEDPPTRQKNAPSGYIMVFRKDPGAVAETRKARGRAPGGKGDGEIGE